MARRGIVVIAFMLAFMPFVAGAEIPHEALEKVALLRVEDERLEHLRQIGQLTPQDFEQRRKKLRSDQAALWKPYQKLPKDELRRADEVVKGLARARLATLTPQWARELEKRQVERRQQLRKTSFEIAWDSRRALEHQRARLRLQKQLEAGTLTRDEFAKRDAEALNEIASLRRKFEIPQTDYTVKFDQSLANLTNALGNNPETFIPEHAVSVLPPGQQPDYDADVRLAADILVKREEPKEKCLKELMPSALCYVTAAIYNSDLAYLRHRYADTGNAFSIAYEKRGYAQLKPPIPAQPPPMPTASQTPRVDQSSEGLGSLVLWVGGAAILLAGLFYLFRKKPPQPPQEPYVSDIYGTASWAPYQTKPASANAVAQGVSFGKSSAPGLLRDAPGAPITSMPEAHTLIIGRTRAGKGTRVVVPTLLRYGSSMLIVDPKGENAAITARTRRDQLQQAVHIVNPWGEMEGLFKRLGFSSATFNPLEVIDRNDPNAVSVAESLAAIICPRETGESKFWSGNATALLSGVFLWLADQPGEQKTLGRARELLAATRKDFSATLVRMAASTAFSGAIKEKVSQLIGMDDKTYSNIMATVNENMNFMSDPRMKAATAQSSLSMRALRTAPTSIYLIAPEEKIRTHGTWLRLVIASAMEAMKKASQTGIGNRRCMFLIDEFGALGRIESIPRDIATMSGRGVDFTLVLQGIDQLKDHYGDARGTILNNCAYKWFCAVNDLDTAKYVSESLGQQTVRTVGTSESTSAGPGGGSASQSTSFGETGRLLLRPEEIINLGRGVAILLNPRNDPYYLRPVDYWQLAATYDYLKDEYPQFYWQPPLSFDENPYIEKPSPPPGNRGMSRKHALDVLGLKEGADKDAIAKAYRTLMKQVHPDKGGTDFFAAQLNAARDVLLN